MSTEDPDLRRISEEKFEQERGRGDTAQINASTDLTALEIAVFRGDRSSVDALLSAGADPNGSDSQRSPLAIASLLGHAEIVNSLLSAGANHRGGGITNDESAPVTADLPLKTALVEGQTEVVERLLKAGSDPNVVFTSGEVSLPAIVQAAGYGDRDILAALIEAGADVNATNDEGVTALIEASAEGHMEIVQMLLNHNADPTLKTNEEGVGPIEAANRNNNPEIRAFLRERVEESD
ncbi:ankyrin repeat protein [Salinibacter ruber]|uniref:Ankyrin repeat protein n=1 Tax=Salinibacter ruber TaxID=146919 RepID=A0AAW5PCD1_9BACT|nr:ankyrin repeat protein [Salinibacter ruber]